MNLGILIFCITFLAYVSNWLNWRYLNYAVVRWLYYLGTLFHEFSHIIFCTLTGATVTGGSVFSREPHIVYSEPKLPLAGNLLISLAPIIGGLSLLFLINRYYLANYFVIPQFADMQGFLIAPFNFLSQLNPFNYRSWLMILLFLNLGASIGPSLQDLKNIWPIMIMLCFVESSLLANFGFLVIILILTNIIIQVILISAIKIAKNVKANFQGQNP